MNRPTFGLGTKSCTWTILLAKSALNCNPALRVQTPLRDIIPFLDPTLFPLKSTLVFACLLFCKTNTIFLTSIMLTIKHAKQIWALQFRSPYKDIEFTYFYNIPCIFLSSIAVEPIQSKSISPTNKKAWLSKGQKKLKKRHEKSVVILVLIVTVFVICHSFRIGVLTYQVS